MIRNASVFLMDEPLSNLDALLRVNTRTEIKRLQRELGKTTIFVTHDQEEAMVLSDRIAIMRDGVLQQYATPDETYNLPVNTFVAGFIGNPRMNFVTGTLSSSDGSPVIASDTVQLPVPGEVAAKLAGSQSRVTMGFRPEHIHVGATDNGSTSATIELIEPVGPVSYLDLSVGGRSFRASVAGQNSYQIGDSVGISLDPAAVHFFDPDNGQRLTIQ
jgi:multiple sugar transport system ATP-binding protein